MPSAHVSAGFHYPAIFSDSQRIAKQFCTLQSRTLGHSGWQGSATIQHATPADQSEFRQCVSRRLFVSFEGLGCPSKGFKFFQVSNFAKVEGEEWICIGWCSWQHGVRLCKSTACCDWPFGGCGIVLSRTLNAFNGMTRSSPTRSDMCDCCDR